MVELILLGIFGIFIALLVRNEGKFRTSLIVMPWLKQWTLFVVLVLVALTITSTDLTYHIPSEDLSFLKLPPWISFSRILQLILCVFGFLWMSNAFLQSRYILSLSIKVIITSSFFISLSSCVMWVVSQYVSVDLPLVTNYGNDIRVRGFFVEGGPYGVFIVGIIFLCAVAWRSLSIYSTKSACLLIGFFAFTLLLTASKAGLLLLLSCIVIYASLLNLGFRDYLFIIIIMGAFFGGTYWSFGKAIEGYIINAINIEERLFENPDDVNIVTGRIAGIFIATSMILDRPILGVGIGNYSVVRNDPTYRGIFPEVDTWDLPGLGLYGYCAELGIPLVLFFSFVCLRLTVIILKSKLKSEVLLISMYPFMAHMLGVQITFFYPWMFSAVALASFFHYSTSRNSDRYGTTSGRRPLLTK